VDFLTERIVVGVPDPHVEGKTILPESVELVAELVP